MSKYMKKPIIEDSKHIIWIDRLLMDALRAGYKNPADVLEYILIKSEEKTFAFVKSQMEKING